MHTATIRAVDWANTFPIIPHPAELIFGFIAFAILYYVVAKKVVPRLEAMYAERAAAIEGQIAEADRAQAEAHEALEQYRAQLAEARGEATRIREEAREQGAQILAEMRGRAQAEAQRITDTASAQLEAERAQTVVSLRQEVGRLATDLAGRVVGESLEDEARQRRTVERFLAELEAGEAAEPAEPAGTARPDAAGGTPDGQAVGAVRWQGS